MGKYHILIGLKKLQDDNNYNKKIIINNILCIKSEKNLDCIIVKKDFIIFII